MSVNPEAARARSGIIAILLLALLLSTSKGRGSEIALSNSAWRVSLNSDASVLVSSAKISPVKFEPRFTLILSAVDPRYDLRFADLGDTRMNGKYNVASWVVSSGSKAESTSASKSNQHVADGFDPRVDQQAGPDRTVDAFRAGWSTEFTAERAALKGDRISWTFKKRPEAELTASIQLPEGDGLPILEFTLIPKTNAWFSVAYTGAPEVDPSQVGEVWQPLIWQEKRFPNQPFLTEAARCTLPMTLVRCENSTWGVAADPRELPFQPMPTPANSRFGVAIRNASGKAQPALFAPILGGAGSKRRPNEAFSFKMRFIAFPGTIPDVYEQIAQGLYGFRDYRSNEGLGSLNRTLERTLAYAMSSWARFDEDLRGSAYETDVPGSVKNVSALHPLSAALVMDDEQYFQRRAKPMLEYVLSREKFLFTTDPKVTGQGASAKMTGPCAPISELSALYEMSGGKSTFLVNLAKKLFGQTRVLNLADAVAGDTWQNALALHLATGESEWLESARNGADQYIKERLLQTQSDFKDKDSRGMFFWTSYAPNWMELYELFECTGEERYLDAARAGARRFAQFVWMCPAIPQGTVTVNEGGIAPAYRRGAKFPRIPIPEETVPSWRVSEIGLTCESSGTSKGHRGIFLATHAPWMLRLAWQADDNFLRDIGRSAVVGRYTSFPGYHMNTARTTVYEKPNFAERSTQEINSTSSLHYNHIWPQISMLIDYLVADAENRSRGAISFPSHFAEGYAYLQLKVYGDRPGKLYGQDNLWLWMPKGLLTFDQSEINYIAARGNDRLYLVLMNQAAKDVHANCSIDLKYLGPEVKKAYEAEIWEQNHFVGKRSILPGKFQVTLKSKGITAIAIDGLKVRPRFQHKLAQGGKAWKTDRAELKATDGAGMVFNFGPDNTWAYVYLQARDTIQKARLTYSTDGTTWREEIDAKFPFEFSLPLTPDANEFNFRIRGVTSAGEIVDSETVRLSK